MPELGIDWLLIRVAAGIIIGFSIGLTGVGGGVLAIPALTLLFGLSPSTAVGTASLYAFLTKIAAAFHHYKLKTVATRTAAWFLTGAVPTTIAVSALITLTVKRLGSESSAITGFQGNLKLIIACVIVFAVALMLSKEGWC